MVGFVKELVDEQGAGSITVGRDEQFRLSKFEKLLITEGVVFVTKMVLLSAYSKSGACGGRTRPNDHFMEER